VIEMAKAKVLECREYLNGMAIWKSRQQ
jgi:hypothetical protein